jgi:predicted RNase H-like nuclease
MTTILGIDAAWTAAQPSGVALIQRHYGRWRCLAAAPSYPSFELLARAVACDWSQGGEAGQADVGRLIAAAEHLAGESLGVAAVDMPVSTADITGRRAADREVSRRFGSRGCSTHSPSPLRPGQLGAALAQQFMVAGFDMATTATAPGTPRRLVEVYPHPALLALLGRDMRVPYKVSKSCSYWPGARIEVRIARLLAEFEAILDGLAVHIDGISVPLPRPQDVETLSSLKRYEDAIDALVCCWVGSQYLDGLAVALGDETAAIWCPRS